MYPELKDREYSCSPRIPSVSEPGAVRDSFPISFLRYLYIPGTVRVPFLSRFPHYCLFNGVNYFLNRAPQYSICTGTERIPSQIPHSICTKIERVPSQIPLCICTKIDKVPVLRRFRQVSVHGTNFLQYPYLEQREFLFSTDFLKMG
jgi:hypothetical protein